MDKIECMPKCEIEHCYIRPAKQEFFFLKNGELVFYDLPLNVFKEENKTFFLVLKNKLIFKISIKKHIYLIQYKTLSNEIYKC